MKAQPIQKTIGGVSFEDRFPHLQENTSEALEWQWTRDAQASRAAQASPSYKTVHDRLLELTTAGGGAVPRLNGGLWFGLAADGDDQVLRASEVPNGPGFTVASRRAISDANGGGAAFIAWIEPSPNGRYVAFGWGVNGDMVGKWSVHETATGRHIADANGLLYSGARAAWLPDESGFWLNDRTPEGLHRLHFTPIIEGTLERPDVVLSQDLVDAKYSGLTLHISPDGRRGIAVTEPHEHIALVHIDLETLEATPFLTEDYEGECDGSWIDEGTYVARVSNGVPRGRVVAIPASTSRDMSTWREIVPESEGFIGWAGVVAGKLYVGDLIDVSLRIRVFNLDGKLIETLPLEAPGSSPSMFIERAIRPTDAFVFSHATFTRSAVTFVHDAKTGELRPIGEAQHKLDGVVVEQRFATSKDSTRIPYFVVRKENVDKAVPQPALVNAYGGFNISMLPTFPTIFVPFIEAGGIFVQASLRGGSEYGRAWHDGGRLFNKRNTIDDLQAVAEALISEGISAPDRMVFHGASNGGMLAGAAAVFQPHLWRAVVPGVPVFDIMEMLPLTADTAGLRAIMYEDYGDPQVPEVARSVIQWSPYHNIKDGIAYPAVYQVFGENDLGCMPFHGRKFTARLEEATSSGRPIYLRVWRNAAHGVGEPADVAVWNGEWLAFAMDQIGLKAASNR